MIEIVSYPPDLSKWDSHKEPFYLELYGETKPIIDLCFAQVLPAGSIEEAPQNASMTSIYQYWWTIGHAEDLHAVEDSPLERLHSQHPEATAVSVYLYFPVSGGWRVKEIVPTVRYLKPMHEQAHMWEQVSSIWNEAAPIAAGVTMLSKVIPTPVSAFFLALSMVTKLHINTVPPTEGFRWSVNKVTGHSEFGLTQGVRWSIPKKMFRELGGRLTGSLAISFIPSQSQQQQTDFDRQPIFRPQPILARAVVHCPDEPIFLPGPDYKQCIQLSIAPYSS